MGAEDAAVDVGLVDHDVAQVLEDVSPAVVMGQEPDVQHVGVREDEVGPFPDLPALLGGRVAVVDRRPQARELELGQAPRLILGERLRRVEVERPLLRIGRERVQHREVEGERLPARGARRDDDVLASPCRFQGFDLVHVELLDAAPAKSIGKSGMEVRRERGEASLLRRDNRGVRDLLGREELVPESGCHGHGAMVASGPLVPRCLTIATSDSGGGAGIQADLKAFARLGCHGTSAIVALTAQNTVEVTAVHEVPPDFIRAQLEAIFTDIGVDAAKTGMLFSRADRRDGRRLPRCEPGSARRRSGHGRSSGPEASAGRRRRDSGGQALSARHGRDAEPPRGVRTRRSSLLGRGRPSGPRRADSSRSVRRRSSSRAGTEPRPWTGSTTASATRRSRSSATRRKRPTAPGARTRRA